jgi:hypothetical protein
VASGHDTGGGGRHYRCRLPRLAPVERDKGARREVQGLDTSGKQQAENQLNIIFTEFANYSERFTAMHSVGATIIQKIKI